MGTVCKKCNEIVSVVSLLYFVHKSVGGRFSLPHINKEHLRASGQGKTFLNYYRILVVDWRNTPNTYVYYVAYLYLKFVISLMLVVCVCMCLHLKRVCVHV